MNPKSPLFIVFLIVVAAGGAFLASTFHKPSAEPDSQTSIETDLTSGASERAPKIAAEPSDLSACVDGDSCVPVEEACPDSFSAVNEKYIALHEERMKTVRQYVECAPPAANLKRPSKAACMSGKCTLAPFQ